MKNRKFFTLCIALLATVFADFCDTNNPQPSNIKTFSNDYRGTWESNDPSIYSGTLTIDFDTIIIDGYTEDQALTQLDGSVDKNLPFRGYPKGVQLRGYSEDGKIFIDYGNGQNGIPYTYTEPDTYPDKNKLLEFTFGDRKEILKYQK
jgi:Zn/Cd-binding protein ZinT